jgi:small-conductance mechanosensitive channel
MDNIIKFFEKTKMDSFLSINSYIIILVNILFLWLSYKFIIFFLHKSSINLKSQYKIRKILTYTFIFIGSIFALLKWFNDINSISTFLGLFTAGIAIALKDLIINIAGWIFIIVKKPFEVGDRIEIGKNAGDVIDQSALQFTILEIRNWVESDQSTGRIVHLPNYKIFKESLSNYSKGFKYIWDEISVIITFESNWEKAKKILFKIAENHAEHLSKEAEEKLKEAAKKFMIYYKNLTPTVYTTVKGNGVQLSIRYLCEPKKRRITDQEIWEDVLKEFSKNEDIDLAYPTQRIVMK